MPRAYGTSLIAPSEEGRRISDWDDQGLPIYFREPQAFCAHKKCRSCERDGTAGLCTYELNEAEDNFCGDCLAGVC